MDLTKILAISGKPGLYRMLSQTKAGFIVESLIDGKRFPVFAHERVSTLEEISIFISGDDDLPLKEVFKKFFDKLEGKAGPDQGADSKILKSFFLETIPDFDQEKVYVSDMKKTIAWYNLLLEKGIMEFKEDDEREKDEASEPSKDIVKNETSETDAPAVE
jgi:hypothetical protein